MAGVGDIGFITMGQLRALQEELHRILFIGSDLKNSRFWPEGLPARLQVYRNTVHGNAYDTLDADFPLTKKQFKDNDWFETSELFFKKYPPAFWELNGCIKEFPKFLKKNKEKPYLSELADYELSDLLAFVHPASIKKGWGRTNPTVIIRVYQHQILKWAVEEANPAHSPAQKPEAVIFYRNSDHEGRIRLADPLALLLLDHFSKAGARLEDAEPKRARLLPKNKIPLQTVLTDLINRDLILL